MLAAPAGVCEWLLRLYRPGLRWRLRTMLGFVAIVAALCGLIADARNRADLQDPIITPLEKDYQTVYVERAGPKWLEFVMPDRYRRRLVGIKMQMHDGATLDEEQIKHLTRLPRLQHLQINVEHRTHGMAVALPEMRRLRSLRIDEYGSLDEDERISHEFLAAIGTLTELERLSLEDVTVTRQSLAHLSGLTKLQSLWLQGFNEDEDLFAYLPPLPRLESIDFGHAQLSSRALQGLSAFPRLKALNLSDAELSRDADLMELASLASLEVLAIDADMLSTGGTQAFGALKQLKKLHVGDQFWSDDEGLITIALDRGKVAVFEPKAEAAQHALQALRRANPSITIDSDTLFMLSN
ncbi:MAG TPA: hypothetical protein VJ783_30515, partial [Pirellulales bacterium]|nr:hypothetical protein [Pirellulales bacterium]